jgi:hypothetical protein
MATTDSKTRQVKKLAFDTLKHFQRNNDIVQHRRSVRFYNNESAPALWRFFSTVEDTPDPAAGAFLNLERGTLVYLKDCLENSRRMRALCHGIGGIEQAHLTCISVLGLL